eukprot:6096910-Pyramimonas_sp.AAC.1
MPPWAGATLERLRCRPQTRATGLGARLPGASLEPSQGASLSLEPSWGRASAGNCMAPGGWPGI